MEKMTRLPRPVPPTKFFSVRTVSSLGEKGEAGAISRPLGALPLSAVGEAGERIFGEDGAVITAALTGFERLCERLWERACVGVVPPLPPVECKLQFLGVEVPDAVNLPCALSKVEGAISLSARAWAAAAWRVAFFFAFDGFFLPSPWVPAPLPLKCPRGAARGAPPIWLGGAANLLVRKPASEEASAIKSACTLRDDVVECTRRALTDCSCMAGAAMCEFGNRVSTSLGRRGRLVLRLK